MTARLESVAALGRPVVPLVKISMNGSSSAMAGRATERPSRVVSSGKSRSTRITGTPTSPSRRARRFSSMSSTDGSVKAMALRISVPVHQPSAGGAGWGGRGPKGQQPLRHWRRRSPPGRPARCHSGRAARWRRIDHFFELGERDALAVIEYVAILLSVCRAPVDEHLAQGARPPAKHGDALTEHRLLGHLVGLAGGGQQLLGLHHLEVAGIVHNVEKDICTFYTKGHTTHEYHPLS